MNEVEEHTAVEELQGVIVRPPFVIGLIRQIILQALENGFVVLKEAFGNRFNVEGFIVAALDFKGRLERMRIQKRDAFRGGAQLFGTANGDAAVEPALFRVLRIIFGVDEVPLGLFAIAEDEQRVGMFY